MKIARNILTANRLREVLSYDLESGVFTWLVPLSNRVKVGDFAGAFRPDGYLVIRVDGSLYHTGRLAWLFVTGQFSVGQIDHKDQNPSNNKFANLRDVPQRVNLLNKSNANCTSKTGIRGVNFDRRRKTNPWRARIFVDGKEIFLGCFPDAKNALFARLTAQKKYHPTNFPDEWKPYV